MCITHYFKQLMVFNSENYDKGSYSFKFSTFPNSFLQSKCFNKFIQKKKKKEYVKTNYYKGHRIPHLKN